MAIRKGVLACILNVLVFVPTAKAAIVLNVFTNPHPVPIATAGTIGFAFAGDKFVGSVQLDGTGALYSTDLNGGNVQLFAPTVSLPASVASEHFVAGSLGLGGFPSRDIYVGAGTGIVHITHDGSNSDTFVSGLSGEVRGILFDAVGTFGHDMLVTTNSGDVYRVNHSGTFNLLASTGEDTEGLDVAPLAAHFGPFDGQLVVASEGSGLLRAITPAGVVTDVNPGNPIPGAEELSFVPLNLGASGSSVEGFYGSDYTPDVIKAAANQFTGFLGDAVVTSETGHGIFDVHWNGSTFVITQIGTFPNQPEDGIFVTNAIINPTALGTPAPSLSVSMTLVLAALLGFTGLILTRLGQVGRDPR